MRIMRNIPALQSYNALTKTNSALSKSIERLSTGLRINSAADDAAGLAISEKMRSQIKGLNQATSNAQDGISMIQTAEGALGETHSMLQRMRELAVQAANDTLTQEDRSYIQLEIDQLKQEIDRISTTTQFNKKQLLDGSTGALWSTDNLETKVIVKGGLREVDQFGQKSAREGNFKITIDSIPGQAQMQKTDLFKIKHANVIMGVSTNEMAGFAGVRVDGLPAGDYVVKTDANQNATDAAEATGAYIAKNKNVATVSAAAAMFFDGGGNFGAGGLEASENQSILFEVLSINTATGSESVTFRVQVMGLDAEGNLTTRNYENLIVDLANGLANTNTIDELGWTPTARGDLKLAANAVSDLSAGDKLVINYALGTASGADSQITISGTLNGDWSESWHAPNSSTEPAGLKMATFGVNAADVASTEVHFKQFFVNAENGTHYEGSVVINFNEKYSTPTAELTGATFEAAYIGQVAKGDVQLRDLDKFWDANGKFLLEDAKTISMVQGDGTKTSITLYSTDTLDSVQKKMNDAIAFGLGQGKYAPEGVNNFVSFVENPIPNGPESVAGTFIIRSLIPGSDGKLSFSGDEDIIKAFSLNVIQEAKESEFRVAVHDAHTGATVASNVRISGNVLYGIVAPNIDVRFDPMADIRATWNEKKLAFDLISMPEKYETIVHLSDNSTVFQIGANQSEDMSIDIGNMGAFALGINNVIVTDRESAARAIGKIDNAIGIVSQQRAKLGAYQNRLEYTITNLTTAATNTTAAESRIRDADMAKEMMEFTKLNILSQAGNSMLAQANQLPQNVLTLLRG